MKDKEKAQGLWAGSQAAHDGATDKARALAAQIHASQLPPDWVAPVIFPGADNHGDLIDPESRDGITGIINAIWRDADENGLREMLPLDTALKTGVFDLAAALLEYREAFVISWSAWTGKRDLITRDPVAWCLDRMWSTQQAGHGIRLCDDCGSIFEAMTLRPTRFCSQRCRTRTTKREQRLRNKG